MFNQFVLFSVIIILISRITPQDIFTYFTNNNDCGPYDFRCHDKNTFRLCTYFLEENETEKLPYELHKCPKGMVCDEENPAFCSVDDSVSLDPKKNLNDPFEYAAQFDSILHSNMNINDNDNDNDKNNNNNNDDLKNNYQSKKHRKRGKKKAVKSYLRKKSASKSDITINDLFDEQNDPLMEDAFAKKMFDDSITKALDDDDDKMSQTQGDEEKNSLGLAIDSQLSQVPLKRKKSSLKPKEGNVMLENPAYNEYFKDIDDSDSDNEADTIADKLSELADYPEMPDSSDQPPEITTTEDPTIKSEKSCDRYGYTEDTYNKTLFWLCDYNPRSKLHEKHHMMCLDNRIFDPSLHECVMRGTTRHIRNEDEKDDKDDKDDHSHDKAEEITKEEPYVSGIRKEEPYVNDIRTKEPYVSGIRKEDPYVSGLRKEENDNKPDGVGPGCKNIQCSMGPQIWQRNSCTGYAFCHNDKIYRMNCPKASKFNVDSALCEPADIVTCPDDNNE